MELMEATPFEPYVEVQGSSRGKSLKKRGEEDNFYFFAEKLDNGILILLSLTDRSIIKIGFFLKTT